MLRFLSQRRARTAAAELSREIARRVLSGDSTPELGQLATTLAGVEGVSGALIAACDAEGYPLAFGARELAIPSDVPLDTLAEIRSGLEPGGGWSNLGAGSGLTPAEHVWARTFHGRRAPRGLLLVCLPDPALAMIVTDCLDHAMVHLEGALVALLAHSQSRLVQRLRRLEGEQIESSERLDTAVVASGLKEIFNANAVTILLREQGKLYLSATTDRMLAGTTVTYDPGEGFIGLVFNRNTPIRLYDACDSSEIQNKVQGNLRRGSESRHPEALAASDESFRFLAVPMRFGGRPKGVIRLLRPKHDSPFTIEEQSALQHSADLFAALMHFSWRQYLADAVLEAETEAVYITRSEPGTGYNVPRVVYAASGGEKLFGRDIKGMDSSLLYPKDEYERVRALLEEAIARDQAVLGPIKSKVKRLNGDQIETRLVDISYRLVTSPFVKPDTHYTISVIRDTTEEQLSARRNMFLAEQHERLIALLDQKGLAYFAADPEGLTKATSPTESRLTGYSEEELLGNHRKGLYNNPAHQRDLVEHMRMERGALVHTVKRLKKKSGEHFLAEATVRMLYDEDQEIGYEGLYEDVTDRIRLQGFLDLDTERLIEEQELYGKLRENAHFQLLFMNSFAHQVRSPLGALIHYLVNFERGIIDAAQLRRDLKYIVGQTSICALQVDNLTYMDKILRDETFEFDPVNLAMLAIQTKLNFDHLAVDKKIRIDVDGKSIDKYLSIRGHKELLRQILMNLIDNGIKYGLPRTRIRIQGRAGPQNYLQVTSRGIPIPRKDRERIFERGFRRPEAKDVEPNGTGLGLWLVRKIAAAHGATIRCTQILEGKRERTAFQIFFKHPNLDRSVARRWVRRSVT